MLSEWVGPDGEVVRTDIYDAMLTGATQFVTEESLNNVTLINDDLFATKLEPSSFDLVHARFVLTPLGRWAVATSRWKPTPGCSVSAAPSSWKTPIGAPGTSTPGEGVPETDRPHLRGVRTLG